MEIALFYSANSESLTALRLSGRLILCEFSWYMQYEWNNPRPIYVFKNSIKKVVFSLWKGLLIFLVFTEEIALKDFIIINITKPSFFLFFSDHRDIKKKIENIFKDYGVYWTNVFRMSHTFNRKLTKLVYVWK